VPGEKTPDFDLASFLAQPGDGRSIVRVRKNQIVFSQGDPADAVYYIQQGKLQASVLSDQGKEAIFASLLSPGEFFGHKCLAGQAHRVWTVTALADGILVRIETSAMLQLIHSHQIFCDLFITHILKHTVRVEASLIDLLFNSSERRLARLLLQLANYGKEDGVPEPVMIEITQETLAEMVGTTRSRVSFFMKRFRKLGYIDYNGQIHVHKSLVNVLIHEPLHGKG
jgi:CRP/FNR family cyclic AMP-dependent transcriptional regulator